MLDKIKNSSWEFIFGRGIGSLHPMMVAGKEVLVVAHNHMIQVLYDQGMVGVISFLVLQYRLYRRYLLLSILLHNQQFFFFRQGFPTQAAASGNFPGNWDQTSRKTLRMAKGLHGHGLGGGGKGND